MKKILSLLIVASLLQGCGPLLIGGAATTAGVVHDRRSAGTVLDDNTLEVKVKATIADNKILTDNSNVSVTCYNGMVLLTGEAYDENIRQQITAAAKSVQGVKRVENQLVIGRRSTFMERTYDSKQTAKVKSALLDIKLPGLIRHGSKSSPNTATPTCSASSVRKKRAPQRVLPAVFLG